MDYEPGCYGDSARGIYLGEHVQAIAESEGWKGPAIPCHHDEDCPCGDKDCHPDIYHEAWTEAEEYMNEHCGVEGYYWGTNDNSDFGLWKCEE
jgi:hypothetical protein